MDAQKIQIIRQTEEKAAQLVSEAEEQANAVVRDANSQSETIKQDAKKTARDKEAALLAEYKQKGEKEAGSITADLSSELSKLDTSASAGEGKAVAYLLDQMKVSYGN